MWEVDWDKSRHKNGATQYWARNLESPLPSAREWHWTFRGVLKKSGIAMPVRGICWEIDWNQRKEGDLVWARNPMSPFPGARDWHWTDGKTLKNAGIPWVPFKEPAGRFHNAQGYVVLTRRGMTAEQIKLCDDLGIWGGTSRHRYILEHRLVVAESCGDAIIGKIVRHVNGVKDDNRPENLIVGTHQDNSRDHATANREAIYWRNRFTAASVMLTDLGVVVSDDFWLSGDED